MTSLPKHSSLGGSGADRWSHCPGSVGISKGIPDDEDDTFSGPGRAAHILAEYCFRKNLDAWLLISQMRIETDLEQYDTTTHEGGLTVELPEGWNPDKVHYVDKEMADAVQVYLSEVRRAHLERNQGNTYIERAFHCPEIHEHFHGRSDLSYVDVPARQLDVWDYKHGAGIIVEVPENWQCMYYACGMLTELNLWDKIDVVKLHIVQPRGWHFDGPHREWSISTDYLDVWLADTLIPAMDTAMISDDLVSGEHCRFCPARGMACSKILSDFARAKELNEMIEPLSARELGEYLTLFEVLKIAHKKHLASGTAAANAGKDIPGWKLTKSRSNRAWKEGAEEQLVDAFAGEAYKEQQLRSPAEIDKLPKGSAATARLAYKPEAGLTLTKASDNRPAVKRSHADAFKPRIPKGK